MLYLSLVLQLLPDYLTAQRYFLHHVSLIVQPGVLLLLHSVPRRRPHPHARCHFFFQMLFPLAAGHSPRKNGHDPPMIHLNKHICQLARYSSTTESVHQLLLLLNRALSHNLELLRARGLPMKEAVGMRAGYEKIEPPDVLIVFVSSCIKEYLHLGTPWLDCAMGAYRQVSLA